MEGPRGLRPGCCGGTGHTPARRDPGLQGQFDHYRRPEGCCGCAVPVMLLALCILAVLL